MRVLTGIVLLMAALLALVLTVRAQSASETSPLPPRKVLAKGIYLTAHTVGLPERTHRLMSLVETTELNALVVDFKDDDGTLTHQAHADQLKDLLRRANRKGIYSIARIVTFKDPRAARSRPELALRRRSGTVWHDRTGAGWLDPSLRDTWEYNLALAQEAVSYGFQEIQFDYVRFPSDGDVSAIAYPNLGGLPKQEVIAQFLQWARERLASSGARVSADIFGLVTTVSDDMGIGQALERVASGVDIISPMVYPSHYSPGNYGLADPEASPYLTVRRGLEDGIRRLGQDKKGTWRPWLQDFSLRIDYTPEMVSQQIRAVEELGIGEWLLWNPGNRYSTEALRKESDSRPPPTPW